MAYATADINAIVAKLEASLSKGFAEVTHEGQRLVYKSTGDILKAIGYFKGLYNSATDAVPRVDTRTFFFYGGNR
jgi:hypothetical protein